MNEILHGLGFTRCPTFMPITPCAWKFHWGEQIRNQAALSIEYGTHSPLVCQTSGVRVVYVCNEPHMSQYRVLTVLLAYICSSYHKDTGVLEEFVGDASWSTAGAALEAVTSFGQDVILILDGFERSCQQDIANMFQFLQKRNPRLHRASSQPREQKGNVKIIMSSTNMVVSEMRNVRFLKVPPLSLHERVQVKKPRQKSH